MNTDDYRFMSFVVCMGTWILFILGLIVWGAGYSFGWWTV